MEKVSFHLECHSRKFGWFPANQYGKNIVTKTIEDAHRELKNAQKRDKRSLRIVEYRIVKKVTTMEVVS